VADREHVTSRVESCHVGGVGIDVLGRFSLQRSCHSSRPLQRSFLKEDIRRQWTQGMAMAVVGCDLRAGTSRLPRRLTILLPPMTPKPLRRRAFIASPASLATAPRS
jgi:hypothetical protein